MTTEEILAVFARVARPIILQYFPKNACIAATRIVIECLEVFDLDVEPLAVTFIVHCNARKLAYVSGLTPEERKHAEAVAADFSRIPGSGADTWDGHLVAVVEGKWLVDASFDQAAMSGLPIPEEVVVIHLPADYRTGNDQLVGAAHLSDGTEIEIQYRPSGDRSFLDAPAWETDHLRWAVLAILCAMGRRTG